MLRQHLETCLFALTEDVDHCGAQNDEMAKQFAAIHNRIVSQVEIVPRSHHVEYF
jgi:hypothetical protein